MSVVLRSVAIALPISFSKMSDKTSSSVGPRSFETISEEDLASPWDELLGNSKSPVPTIIKTNASSSTICKDELLPQPRVLDAEANKLTRSKSLNQRRNSSGLLNSIPKSLRLSLRGVRSEPSSVKDVPTTRNDSSLNLLLRWVFFKLSLVSKLCFEPNSYKIIGNIYEWLSRKWR